MPRIVIEDLQDPRLAAYRALKQTNETRWAGQFIAEGEKLVERMLAGGIEVVSVLASEHLADRVEPQLPPETPVYVVPTRALDEVIGFHFHRGILACGQRPVSRHWTEVVRPLPQTTTLVLCPDVKDPENLGSIIRLCAAFGVQGLLLGPHSADPFSRRVLRVSMGTVFRLPVQRLPVDDALWSAFQQHQFETIATVLDPGADPLQAQLRAPRTVLLLGSEGPGLTPEVIGACDRRWTIPMAEGIDSLNVAVSAGIFLHHLQGTGR